MSFFKKMKSYFVNKSEEDIKKALKDIQNNGNRPLEHSIVILIGESGVGKTSTIKHLLGHQNDINFKINDSESETRETVEYVLTLSGKEDDSFATGNTVSLGIVDTPGINDTEGLRQDARNMASLHKFLKKHEALKREGSESRRQPNLVLIMLNANDNRYAGPNSPLQKSLRMMSSKEMQLTDGKNLIIVLTHANSAISKEEWPVKTERISKYVREIVKKITNHPKNHKVPVVFIENKLEASQKSQTDWTFLNDNTAQPRNLFAAITGNLSQNRDTIAHCAITSFFGRDGKQAKVTSQTTMKVEASQKKEKMTETERMLYRILKKDAAGSNDSSTEESDEEDKVSLSLPQESVETPSASDLLSTISDDRPEESKCSQTESALSQVEAMVDMSRPFGKCFNLKQKQMLEEKVFIPHAFKDSKSTVLPENRTESFEAEELEKIDGKWEFDATTAAIDLQGRVERPKKNYNRETVLEEFTIAKVEFPEQEIKKTNLNQHWISDLKSLKTPFDTTSSECLKRYRKFFERWGHGYVKVAHAGGRIFHHTYSITRDTSNKAEFGMRGPHPEFPLDDISMSASIGSCSDLARENYGNFEGGSIDLQKFQHKDQWIKSLEQKPIIFVKRSELCTSIKLYSDLIKEVEDLKKPLKHIDSLSEALSDAIKWSCMETRYELAQKEEKKIQKGIVQSFKSILGWTPRN